MVEGGAFTLVRSDRRTLGLVVNRNGALTVRAPRRASARTINTFVAARAAWIAAARARLTALPARAPPPGYGDGAVHRHLGRDYVLKAERGLRTGVRLQGDALMLTLHRPADERARERTLAAWRRAEAERLFAERLATLMPPFAARGLAVPPVTVRVLRRRYGSMSRSGRMTLALGLLRAPLAAIDYVIAHELCHLVHFDHGPGFRALMNATMPDHRARRAMLAGVLD